MHIVGDQWYTVREAAQFVGLCRQSILLKIYREDLTAFRGQKPVCGKYPWLILGEDLLQFKNERIKKNLAVKTRTSIRRTNAQLSNDRRVQLHIEANAEATASHRPWWQRLLDWLPRKNGPLGF